MEFTDAPWTCPLCGVLNATEVRISGCQRATLPDDYDSDDFEDDYR